MFARLFRGGAWLGAGSFSEQGFRFMRNMILARLLVPEAFGEMGIVLSCCALARVITGLGVKEAVIQSPHGSERTYLNAAWFLSVGRGVVLYAFGFLTAPWIAAFYQRPELSLLLRFAFLSFVLQGAFSPRAFVAIRQKKYRDWALIQYGGGIIGVATTITLGILMRNVWALIIGYLMESFAVMVISMVMCPFWPRFHFDRQHWQALWRYNRGMLGMPLLTLIYTDASVFVMGKLCTQSELGFYVMAASLARAPTNLFVDIIKSLLLPAFADIQEDARRLNRYLVHAAGIIIGLGFPAVVFVILYRTSLLEVVYGTRYTAVSSAFGALFANEILVLCNVPLVALFLAVGQPALLRRANLVRALLVALLIYPAVRYGGAFGAAATPLVAIALSYGFQLGQARSLTRLRIIRFLAIFPRALLFTFPVLLAWVIDHSLTAGEPAWVSVLVGAAVTAALYSVVAILAGRHQAVRRLLWPAVGSEVLS